MAEDFKHVLQTCLELQKMIDAISLAIEQLRQQQSSSPMNDRLTESFADNYTRKMLEDNEINMLKFLGRYLSEKEKLSKLNSDSLPADSFSAVSSFPTFSQWLKIVGVVSMMDSKDSSLLSTPVEEILWKANGDEMIEKLCCSATFTPPETSAYVLRTIMTATENLRYCINCLRSNTYPDPEKLSWSHTEVSASQLLRHMSASSSKSSKSYLNSSKPSSAAGSSNQQSLTSKNNLNPNDPAILISQLVAGTDAVSPLQTSDNFRPRIAALHAPESGATLSAGGTIPRRSLTPRDSTLSTLNSSDAEEQLALRTWKDIDGVVRRYSNTNKGSKRKGLWDKFMTWSARRHMRSNGDNCRPAMERAPSMTNERTNSVNAPRRLISDPGKENKSQTLSPSILTGKSRSPPAAPAVSSPSSRCMIHVFTANRVFFSKCDYCHRPMAFSCVICTLCRLRVHSSCAAHLPKIYLNTFKMSSSSSSKLQSSTIDSSPSPQPPVVFQSPSPPFSGQNEPLPPPSPPPSPPSQGKSPSNIPRAETIGEPAVPNLGSHNDFTSATSAPVFSKPSGFFAGGDGQNNGDEAFASGRKDSVDSANGAIFVFPRRNTEISGEKTAAIGNIPEEGPSPPSSPSYNYSTSFSVKSHMDSAGSSSDYQMASPPGYLNGTTVSTPGSYVESRRQFRRPARMSTFSEWSVTLKEWLIPFSEVTREPQPIARGRYTTVYRGIWHGDVAVKLFHGLDEESEEGSKVPFFSSEQLVRTFRDEVAILPHTRHENLVLFLGASIDNEQLVIMSTFCKGRTLDSLIYSGLQANGNGARSAGGSGSGAMHHVTSPQGSIDQFSSLLTTGDSLLHTATQIAQAVAYLHNKGILHKDLRLRNIFIEANGRILLSDYGIFNATRLATNRHPDVLFVSRSWLFCLAPELARSLTVSPATFAMPDMNLPFSEKSDVFAFGCVWFELLHRLPPVENTREDCHLLIYERGNCKMPQARSPQGGLSLPIESCHELLAACWAKDPNDRPHFAEIILSLEKLSPLLATAAAVGISSGGIAANSHGRAHNRSHLGSSHRFTHHPVRSPSQPLRGGSARGPRGLPFVEPLTADDSSQR